MEALIRSKRDQIKNRLQENKSKIGGVVGKVVRQFESIVEAANACEQIADSEKEQRQESYVNLIEEL